MRKKNSLWISFINGLQPENASEVTSILMDEEQYVLHDWERMEIFVKGKKEGNWAAGQ